MYEWVGSEGNCYRFAAEVARTPVELCVRVSSDPPVAGPPEVTLHCAAAQCTWESEPSDSPGVFDIHVTVAYPAESVDEDEIVIEVSGQESGVPDCRIIVRRTRCAISTALLKRGSPTASFDPQTQAALLWRAWRRYSEIVALKRFTSGKSGTDVLAFRPRLRAPETEDPALVGAPLPDVLSEAWGSCLLVKTGEASALREEWDRFRLFLVDRLHPFMARSEQWLPVRSAAHEWMEPVQASLIASFLGGDLLQCEPLEDLVRGVPELDDLRRVIAQVFEVAATWYASGVTAPLGNWQRMVRTADSETGGILVFDEYDLTTKPDRERYATPLLWDIPFARREHLDGHLLGADQDGLLYRLMEVPVRYSVIHGDLHPRNALVGADNVWLLDFGHTGIGPTLFDFAKLEVYIRLWCLDVPPSSDNIEDHARVLEAQLLDQFTAVEGSLEPIRQAASGIGVSPDDLTRIACCIGAIRREALRYCQGMPDRRDYLAVLFLTVLHTLCYAGRSPELAENFRLLMGLHWVLEDTLSSIVGMRPFERNRARVTFEGLLDAECLVGRGAPGRVVYRLARPDGQKALAPLAATRGVLQGASHHLDVLDHTLLALAYLEEILADPVGCLLDPRATDTNAAQSLEAQGIELPPPAHDCGEPEAWLPGEWVKPYGAEIEKRLEDYLDDDTELIAKWAMLFHDVGKAATRAMTADKRTGGHRVQFAGHEVYGLQLIEEHLLALFPDPEARERVVQLMRLHHRHHSLVGHYAEPSRLAALRAALETRELDASERKQLLPLLNESTDRYLPDFPLLILHGFADLLACRGPAMKTPLGAAAEIDLALLALYSRYPEIRHRQEMRTVFEGLTKGIARELGLRGRAVGKAIAAAQERFLEQTCPSGAASPPGELPTRDDVVEWARQARDAKGS